MRGRWRPASRAVAPLGAVIVVCAGLALMAPRSAASYQARVDHAAISAVQELLATDDNWKSLEPVTWTVTGFSLSITAAAGGEYQPGVVPSVPDQVCAYLVGAKCHSPVEVVRLDGKTQHGRMAASAEVLIDMRTLEVEGMGVGACPGACPQRSWG